MARQLDPTAVDELAEIFAARRLDDWLDLVDGEDVCVGPVSTLGEAAAEFGAGVDGKAPSLGEHTHLWRAVFGLTGA